MVAARKGSPLAIGHGDGEMFVGSDAIALAPLTDRITYLEEGDWAVVTRAGAEITMPQGAWPTARSAPSRSTRAVDKAGHKHFMAKEIAEQPTVVGDALSPLPTTKPARRVICPARTGTRFRRRRPAVMVACGTAFYACLTRNTGSSSSPACPSRSISPRSSATASRPSPADRGDLRQPVGRDRRHAGRAALLPRPARRGSVGGQRARKLDRAGKRPGPADPCRAEIGVASTKAFTCQLVGAGLLALKAAGRIAGG
jgi:glucosamine--fructose-6-phosphate aminotransferase (isomerizing)